MLPSDTSPESVDTGSGSISMADATSEVVKLLQTSPTVLPPKDVAPRPAAQPATQTSAADDLEDDSDELPDDEAEDFEPEGAAPVSDEPEADEDEPDEQEEVTATSRRGKTLTLTRGQLNAGLRRADYDRKTAAAAEVRRQFEGEVARVQQERTRLSEALEAHAKAEEAAIPPEPDQVTRDVDPGAWAAAWQERNNAIARVNVLRQHRETLQTQAQADANKVLADRLKSEADQLLTKVPSWKDPKRFERDTAIIRRNVAKQYGFSEQEVGSVADHRQVLLMRDALRYRQAVAQRETIKPDVTPVTPILRPGGKAPKIDPKVSRIREANARFQKSGSIEDAAALMMTGGLISPPSRRRR